MPILIKARNARLVVFGYNVATDRIVWTRDPTTQHFIGDTLDLTGTIITAYYKDGTMSDITELCSYDPPEGAFLREGGELDLTATYIDRASNTFDCNTTIRVGTIEFIRFSQVFTDQYYVGDTPDVSQLRVEAVWTDLSGEPNEDGQTTTSQILRVEDITDRCTFTINGEPVGPFIYGGENSVEAHFTHELAGEFYCFDEFKVGAASRLIIVGDTSALKENTQLNLTGFQVYCQYTDDGTDSGAALKSVEVTGACTMTFEDRPVVLGLNPNVWIPHVDYFDASLYPRPEDKTKTHAIVINVHYNAEGIELDTDCLVDTIPINYIYWATDPDELDYKDGQTISLDGGTVEIQFSNGDVLDVTDQCVFDPADGTTFAGHYDLTATFTTHAGDIYECYLVFNNLLDDVWEDPDGELWVEPWDDPDSGWGDDGWTEVDDVWEDPDGELWIEPWDDPDSGWGDEGWTEVDDVWEDPDGELWVEPWDDPDSGWDNGWDPVDLTDVTNYNTYAYSGFRYQTIDIPGGAAFVIPYFPGNDYIVWTGPDIHGFKNGKAYHFTYEATSINMNTGCGAQVISVTPEYGTFNGQPVHFAFRMNHDNNSVVSRGAVSGMVVRNIAVTYVG